MKKCKKPDVEISGCTIDESNVTKHIEYPKPKKNMSTHDVQFKLFEIIGKNSTVIVEHQFSRIDKEHNTINIWIDGLTLTDEKLLELIKFRRTTGCMNLVIDFKEFHGMF